jgi:pimeloyl-ACP methyl ester carboxylesterase
MGEQGWVRAGAALLATLGVLAGGPAASAATPASRVPRDGPAGNAFYAPRQVSPGRPGDVVWSSPIISPAGSRAWKILYHSRAVDGRDVVVSGIVITPTAKPPSGGWPVVTWAHGTEGLADACAPSKALDIAYRIPGIQSFIKQGYVVVATDYQGLGTPGEHPYLVGVSEGRGVLDIARAAHEMSPANASTKVLVYGHSQGGQAALFAGQIAATYAPDLHLLGVAAVAPVSDLTELLPEATATPAALGYAVMAAVGFHAAYPDTNLASVLTPLAIAGLGYVDQHCAADVIDHYAEFTPSQIIAQSPLIVPAFAALLQQNTAGTVATAAPLFIAQGDRDELVPKPTTDQYVQRACGVGDHILYRVYPGQDHIGARDASVKDIQAWMAARVAGQPAPSTC